VEELSNKYLNTLRNKTFMDKYEQYLAEWFEHFIKNKDLVLRKIDSIGKGKDGFDLVIKNKDKSEGFIVVRFKITDVDDFISLINGKDDVGVVLYNTKENLSLILENWKKFVKYEKLTLYFVNPFSELDTKWIIMPCVHDRVTEKESLKRGLQALFDGVGEVTKALLDNNL